METMHKRVASVTPVPLGDETTTAQVTTDTVILVANSGDFYEDGGHVRIDGTVYTYSAGSVEEGEDDDAPAPSITLDSGLVGNVAAGTAVEVWNPATGAVVTDWMAEVTDDLDGSPGEAYLHHTLIPLLAEGLPPGVGDSVTVTVDESGDWNVTNIRGKTPVLNAGFVADTDAPSDSPILTVVGLLETFLLHTTSVDATTELTYQVSTDYDSGDPPSATWDDLLNMPVRTTVLSVRTLPDGSAFATDTDYTFRALASNAAGEAPDASDPVTAQLNTDAAAVVASQVIADEVIAGFALLGTVHIGGDTFTLTPPGVDPENLPGGLRIELTDGGLVHLPADGSAATFSGHVVADSLLIINGAEINGASNLSGEISMDATISDPPAGPAVINTYQSLATAVSSPTGFCRNIADDGWVICTAAFLYEVDDSGATTAAELLGADGGRGGVTRVGSFYYVAIGLEGSQYVVRYDASLTSPTYILIASSPPTTSCAIGTDGTNLVLAWDYGATCDIERRTTSGAFVDQVLDLAMPDADIGGVYRGSADFGADRWVAQPRSANVRVYNVAGTRQSAEEWPRPSNTEVRGLWWDGTYFWAIDNSGVIRRLEPIASAPAATYWWSYAWVDSDTHTTLVSPQTSHARKARAKVAVTATSAPQEGTAGTHVANQINIFAATSAVATKYLQGGGSLAVGTKKLTTTSVVTSGTAAPGSNNWSAVFVPAVLSADAGGFTVDGSSNGSVGTGTFRDSVDARVTANAATAARLFTGTTSTATGTAAKAATISGYTPAAGDTLALTLTNGNTVASPTLNVNAIGAKAIQLGGAAVDLVGGSSAAGTIWALRYDGTVWHLAGSQAPNANLSAIAGLTSANNKMSYWTGSGTAATTDLTAAGRALLDDATAVDMLTTLGALSDSMTSNVQTGTTYTVVAADANVVVQGNHATGITITLPTVAGGAPAVDKRFRILARGAGPVTLDASAVTLNGANSGAAITSYVLPARWSMIELWHRATDNWVLSNLSPPAARGAMKTSATEFTTTTLAADTDLSIALPVGTHDFEAMVLYDGTVANDAKFSPTFSGTATVGAAVSYARAAAAPTTGTNVAWDNGTHSIGAMVGWGGTFSSAGASPGVALPFKVEGRITVTVAGNLGISVAKQNNTDTGGGANATRTLAFSYITAKPSAIA